MYCKNCKKHAGNMFPKKLVLISKNKIKGKPKCAICFTERTFIREIEGKYGLETELDIFSCRKGRSLLIPCSSSGARTLLFNTNLSEWKLIID